MSAESSCRLSIIRLWPQLVHHDGNPGAAIAFDYSAIKGRPTSSISFIDLIEISCCLEVPQNCVGMDLNLPPWKEVDAEPLRPPAFRRGILLSRVSPTSGPQ